MDNHDVKFSNLLCVKTICKDFKGPVSFAMPITYRLPLKLPRLSQLFFKPST